MIRTEQILRFLYLLFPFCAAALIRLDVHNGRKEKTERTKKTGGTEKQEKKEKTDGTGGMLLLALLLTVAGTLLCLYLRNPAGETALLVFIPLLAALL